MKAHMKLTMHQSAARTRRPPDRDVTTAPVACRSTPYLPYIETFLTSHLDHAMLMAAEGGGTAVGRHPPPRLRKPVLLEEFGKRLQVGPSQNGAQYLKHGWEYPSVLTNTQPGTPLTAAPIAGLCGRGRPA